MGKKIIYIFFILVLTPLIILTSCRFEHKTIEETRKHIEDIEESLEDIAEKYGYTLEDAPKDIYLDNAYAVKAYIVTLDKNQDIVVVISNDCHVNDYYNNDYNLIAPTLDKEMSLTSGVERYNIYHRINTNECEQNFALDFVVDLANAVSGRQTTREECDGFLYNVFNGDKKNITYSENHNDDKIYASEVLNFWENYGVDYTLNYDNIAKFSLWGLTSTNIATISNS